MPFDVVTFGEHLRKGAKLRTVALPVGEGEAIAWLYAHGEVVERRDDEARAHFAVRLSPADLGRFKNRH